MHHLLYTGFLPYVGSFCWFIFSLEPSGERLAPSRAAWRPNLTAQPISIAAAISCRFLSLLAALTVFRLFQAHPKHGMVHHAAEFFCLPAA